MNKIHFKIGNVIWILFIINSLLIISYIFPFRDMIDLFTKQEAGAIGIIGGIDGPTAIFISSQINWYIVVLVALEIICGIYLLLTHLKKK
ncbi:sodium ion-translocating decarboxylase subunit beta [Labilibaculum sp.]|uniref:sodium ion-translocating decarboxylase subunit beta n=1 Tax=Labilibaculum sp. TaxID=2060723 RepID=UPI002AA77726|nr:sodium ion-translocating decarboxylase subunit beta [Labilibaculum sp.]